jgi:hypothetical protein
MLMPPRLISLKQQSRAKKDQIDVAALKRL